MGALYRVSRTTHAQSTSADSITFDIPAGRTFKVHSGEVTGMANALAAGAEMGIFRTSANGSGGTPTSLVIKPVDPNGSVPSGLTAKYGYGTQPTLEADPLVRMSYQPAGGKGRYPVLPGAPAEFWSLTAYQVSVRGIAGTPNCAVEIEFEV